MKITFGVNKSFSETRFCVQVFGIKMQLNVLNPRSHQAMSSLKTAIYKHLKPQNNKKQTYSKTKLSDSMNRGYIEISWFILKDRSIDRSIDRWIDRSIDRWIDRYIDRYIDRSIDRSIDR